jgi:hypothetical protein
VAAAVAAAAAAVVRQTFGHADARTAMIADIPCCKMSGLKQGDFLLITNFKRIDYKSEAICRTAMMWRRQVRHRMAGPLCSHTHGRT